MIFILRKRQRLGRGRALGKTDGAGEAAPARPETRQNGLKEEQITNKARRKGVHDV